MLWVFYRGGFDPNNRERYHAHRLSHFQTVPSIHVVALKYLRSSLIIDVNCAKIWEQNTVPQPPAVSLEVELRPK